MAVSELAKTIVGKTHQVLEPLIPYDRIHSHRTLDFYWPVIKMQVAHSESINCK